MLYMIPVLQHLSIINVKYISTICYECFVKRKPRGEPLGFHGKQFVSKELQ